MSSRPMISFARVCSLELKTLPTEQASLWVDLFMRSMNSDDEKPETWPVCVPGMGF